VPETMGKMVIEMLVPTLEFCGRTEIDHGHGIDSTRCRYNSLDISSEHLIVQCPLLASFRGGVLRHTPIIPAKEIILDEEMGPRLQMTAQVTGL
jgi:hypothetical protein